MEMNKFKKQSVLGIITCNREHMLRKLVDSIDSTCFDKMYIINNGAPLKGKYNGFEILKSNRNPTPVGIGKNWFIREARKTHPNGWLFVLEDDVTIINNEVWQRYIETSLDSGITGQLSYALHGGIAGGNVNADATPKIKATVKYSKFNVNFYQFGYAAFTLYHASIFDFAGYMDERYINAAEHLDHYLTINKDKNLKGVPIHWFPDIADSFLYIEDQKQNFEDSSIRTDKDFRKNFMDAWSLFKLKHGDYPNEVPDVSKEALMQRLTELEFLYASQKLLN